MNEFIDYGLSIGPIAEMLIKIRILIIFILINYNKQNYIKFFNTLPRNLSFPFEIS